MPAATVARVVEVSPGLACMALRGNSERGPALPEALADEDEAAGLPNLRGFGVVDASPPLISVAPGTRRSRRKPGPALLDGIHSQFERALRDPADSRRRASVIMS